MEPTKTTEQHKKQRKKAGYVLSAIAVSMFVLSLALGGDPFSQINGHLLWGLLVLLSFVKLTDKQYRIGIAATVVLFLAITVLMSVSPSGYEYSSTYRDAIENPPPSGGEYLNAQEFGMRLSHYLPMNSDLSAAQKMELCLSVAEENFADVTTPEQRKQGCSYYASATRQDYQEGIGELIEYLDEQTPTGRLAFCKSKGSELFGRNVTQQEADVTCEWIANNWQEARAEFLKALPES